MFVCNTHHTTTEDVVKQALEECSAEAGEPIIAKKVYRMSREGMYRVSWRVTVSFRDRERVISAESWPEGWGVRKFNGYIRDDQKPAAPFQSNVGATPNTGATPKTGAANNTGDMSKTTVTSAGVIIPAQSQL